MIRIPGGGNMTSTLPHWGATFTESFRWPVCYHAEMNEAGDEMRLWLEYIDGISGLELTGDMYEQAALELGRYQGKLYADQPEVLHSLANLSHADFMKNTYLHYRSWPVVYDYIRSEECEFPQHVRQMLIDIDEHSDNIFLPGLNACPWCYATGTSG
ncbi:hypothetical protein ACFTAO_01425 [Paenibacillus rhizoplanae]